MMDDKPKLRQMIDAFPAEMEGEHVICLRDNSGISNETLAIPPMAFYIAALCDGQNTVADMLDAFEKQYGERPDAAVIDDFLARLREACFLEGPEFEARKAEALQTFRASDTRKAAHAGAAYPKRLEELKATLDGYFDLPSGGPGHIDKYADKDGVVAIAAPHIDMHRGGSCYAHAYKALVEGCKARTFIVLGTLHQQASAPFIVTDKSFETPLGAVPCDRDLAADLMARAGLEHGDDELAHISEHSVEFQAVFLRHLFGAANPINIVPILCGPFEQGALAAEDPMTVPEIGSFIGALKTILQERGDSVGVIASIDLSHVGQRFGDEVQWDDDMLKALETSDRALLGHAEKVDAAGFYKQNRMMGDRTHICGFPALYTLLASTNATSGQLLNYGQAPEAKAQSVVTFGAMAFRK
jgi:MEMO1 family protein